MKRQGCMEPVSHLTSHSITGGLLAHNTLLNFIGQAAKGLHKPLTKLDMRKVKIQGLTPKMTYLGNLGISLGKTNYLLKEVAKKACLSPKILPAEGEKSER